MNLDDLRAVQAEERGSDGVQHLPDSFYRDVVAYIEELRNERTRRLEDSEDPFRSAEVRQLTHEIETAQEVAEAIYDRRLAKIVKHASLKAAGMATEETGLTDEESALFADLVSRIESHRESMIDEFAGSVDHTDSIDTDEDRKHGPSTADGEDDSADGDSDEDSNTDPRSVSRSGATGQASSDDTGFDAGEAMATDVPDSTPPGDEPRDGSPEDELSRGGTDNTQRADHHTPGQTGGAPPNVDEGDRTTVRITEDVGEIMGVDERVYNLAPDDVVTLPTENATPLIDRDAATPIK